MHFDCISFYFTYFCGNEKKELRSAARFIILNHLIRFLIVCLVYMDAEEFSIFSDHFSLLEQNREVHSMQVWALEINRRNKRFMQWNTKNSQMKMWSWHKRLKNLFVFSFHWKALLACAQSEHHDGISTQKPETESCLNLNEKKIERFHSLQNWWHSRRMVVG